MPYVTRLLNLFRNETNKTAKSPKNNILSPGLTMKNASPYLLFLFIPFLLNSCDTADIQPEESVYPMYLDENHNKINDYVEQISHESGVATATDENRIMRTPEIGEPGHAFADENGDGICDYAQNGSPTWHGPGFIDENNNGMCDYWDQSSSMHQRHEGMKYHDENRNLINDYFENETHMSNGHNFIDEDEDGICDYAQDGSPIWHGPGFEDANQNGICDFWEESGRGHGGMGGGRRH